MDKDIIERWYKNKENLKRYFETHVQREYSEYKQVVGALIKYCLNNNVGSGDEFSELFDVSDYGDYQGTQIFLLHKDTYQPNIGDYYVFDNYYGSCSGCDTLLGISNYDEGYPSEEQVSEYMNLCLHMVQRMKCLSKLYELDNMEE